MCMDGHIVSPGICILGCIREILLRQPLPLLVILRDVDALDLENDRPRAVVAAGEYQISLRILAGTPAAITLVGMSWVTTAPAAIIELSPIVTPLVMTTPAPIHTLLPI